MPGRSAPPAVGKFSQAVQQRVHQRPARVARARMDHHPGGFVHDHEIVVHVQQIERQIFRQRLQRRPRQNFDLDGFSGRDSVRNLGDVAVHAHVAFADQFLDARAAKLRNALGEKQIQPPPGVSRRGGEGLVVVGSTGFSLWIFRSV